MTYFISQNVLHNWGFKFSYLSAFYQRIGIKAHYAKHSDIVNKAEFKTTFSAFRLLLVTLYISIPALLIRASPILERPRVKCSEELLIIRETTNAVPFLITYIIVYSVKTLILTIISKSLKGVREVSFIVWNQFSSKKKNQN